MASSAFKLFCTAYLPDQFPKEDLAEILLVGRSNVGKSSILNQLAGHGKKRPKDGARVSQTPGCTQSINFYHYRPDITLVDFPGFGYAKWPDQVRKKINRLIEAYLYERKNIALIIHLVDARLPLQPVDTQMIEMGKNFKTPYLLSLNKCDKLSRQNINKKIKEMEALIKSFHYTFDILPTSALSGQGINELKLKIKSFAELFNNKARD